MNRYKITIPNSYRRNGDVIGNYNSNCVDKCNENIIECYNNLRLLSINEARKMFGIRHETLKKLIAKNKIGHIIIKDKIKIPFWCLKKFQEEQIKLTANKSINQNNGEAKEHLTLNSIQGKIDFIINKYNNCSHD